MTSGQKRRKEEKEKKEERGVVRREGRERRAERRKEARGRQEAPLGVLHLLGCASFTPWGVVGSRGLRPTSSGSLVSSSTSTRSSGFFLPSRLPFPWLVFLPGSFSYLLGPHMLTLFSALVSPWASPPPGASPSLGWLRCPLISHHTSCHIVWSLTVERCVRLLPVPAVEEVMVCS